MKRKVYLLALVLFHIAFMAHGQSSNLTITKAGSGEQSIVLVSGLACKGKIWNQTVDSLSKNATVYSLDYFEDKNHSLITIDQIADEVIDWAASQKLDNITLVGHSLGGIVALNVASKIPNQVGKLIIVDAFPAISALSNPGFVPNSKNDCTPFVQKFTSMTKEQFDSFYTANLSQMTTVADSRKMLLDWAKNYDRTNYASLLCDYLNTGLRKAIRSINCPTMILASSGMKPLEANISDQYLEIKQHEIIFSEKGLHFLMFDDFDWYINAIKSAIN